MIANIIRVAAISVGLIAGTAAASAATRHHGVMHHRGPAPHVMPHRPMHHPMMMRHHRPMHHNVRRMHHR